MHIGDQCMYGAPVPKRTVLAGNIEGLESFHSVRCQHIQGHDPVIGFTADGQARTAQLAQYPPALCKLI
eukprot:5189789-Lingulodinium_polyedra.AAC.1